VKDIQVNGVWRTVLFAGLRQGTHSYFALDITDPDNPSHLFTFAYDKFNDVVSFWDEDGVRTNYDSSLTVPDDYDYSALGESWSDPVITKIEHNGLDKWVAVIGGGYNNNISNQFGSAVYVIDLGDYGKIIEKITISDNDATNNIVNSVPARMSLITPDTTTIFKKSGGIAYFTDLEGNFWKINLTNEGTQFEVTRVFDGEATLDNDRMAYFQPTATLLDDGRLVHYYGTADMMRIGRVSSSIRNRGYAIIDENFPEEDGPMSFDASDMQNVTATESACPDETQKGWFFNLGSNEKITASATIKSGIVIFSRYTPDVNNLCSAGTSKISEHDHACGTLQRETELGSGMATEAIVYKNKLYIGVSSDAPDSGNLPDGFIKTGNLIIGDPIADSETDVDLEYWSEEF
jgi:type IV pilus assembly protein PilY1